MLSLLSVVKHWILSLSSLVVADPTTENWSLVRDCSPHVLTGRVRNAGILSPTWEEKCKRRYTFLVKRYRSCYVLQSLFSLPTLEEYMDEQYREWLPLTVCNIVSSGFRVKCTHVALHRLSSSLKGN